MLNYELNLRDYIRIIRKRSAIIASITILVASLSWWQASKKPMIYKAHTTLKVGERKTVAGLLTESIVYSPGNIMNSYARLIKGYDVLTKVAIEMGTITKDSNKELIHGAVTRLESRISASIVERTNLIEIVVTGKDPEEVVKLANTVSRVFRKETSREKKHQATTVRTYIKQQIDDLEVRIRRDEEKVRTYNENIEDIRMSQPIEDKLVDLEFELVSLLRKYTEKHPKVLYIKEQIDELEAQLAGFSVESLDYSSLKRQIEINKNLYAVLKEKLEEARINEIQKVEEITEVNPAVKPKSPINPRREISLILGIFLGLVMGVVIAFIVESLDTSLGTIEDVESILKLPVLGVVPSVRTKKLKRMDFLQKFKNKFSPVAKQTMMTEAYVRLIVHNEPKSSISESYRAIRTNMQISEKQKTFLITSAGPREGKTTTLVNLGLAIAQTGKKILLVSSDLRRPAVAKTFGMYEEPGLNEVITNICTLDECLRNMTDLMLGDMNLVDIMRTPGIENIFILPCGHIPHNPAELLVTDKMKVLEEELKKRFDVILFDSPPVLPITDACLLSSKVDATVLVYEAGRTSRSALSRVKGQLEASGAKIIGVVLNHTSKEIEINLTFPYYKNKYYNYYNYYTQEYTQDT